MKRNMRDDRRSREDQEGKEGLIQAEGCGVIETIYHNILDFSAAED